MTSIAEHDQPGHVQPDAPNGVGNVTWGPGPIGTYARVYSEAMVKQQGDEVDHPPHYSANPSGIECIDVVEHMSFNRGNAMKYLWRAGEKPNVDIITDLRKAVWYIEREIDKIERERDS